MSVTPALDCKLLHASPGARSILHKNLRQRKLMFQWVIFGPKGRNSPGTGFFSVVLTIWGGSKVNFPPRTLNKFESYFLRHWLLILCFLFEEPHRVCLQILCQFFQKLNFSKKGGKIQNFKEITSFFKSSYPKIWSIMNKFKTFPTVKEL